MSSSCRWWRTAIRCPTRGSRPIGPALGSAHQSALAGGKRGPDFPQQPVPDYVHGTAGSGPSATPFNDHKLIRDWHENISNFSLCTISCWGIHHLDIAQWETAPTPPAPVAWKARASFPGRGAAMRSCVGRSASSTTVRRRSFSRAMARASTRACGSSAIPPGSTLTAVQSCAEDDKLLRDPQNKYDTMPLKLPVSRDHVGNFLNAVKERRPGDLRRCHGGPQRHALPDRPDCREAGSKLEWDPKREQFVADDAANRMLLARPPRSPWKLPVVW